MNLNLIQPKNKTENLLLSIAKNCETLIEQTHRKAEETLEFKMTKSRKIFHFNPPIQIKGSCMIGLINLEVNISVFNIAGENNKFDFYTDKIDEFSSEELKDELNEILIISDITPYQLQHGTIGPHIIEAYRILRLEKKH